MRGRITPVDVVLFGVAIFILAQLAPPVYDILEANQASMSTGTQYLFYLIVPGLLLTILGLIYLTGASGGAR